jgi:hypothetical protein
LRRGNDKGRRVEIEEYSLINSIKYDSRIGECGCAEDALSIGREVPRARKLVGPRTKNNS